MAAARWLACLLARTFRVLYIETFSNRIESKPNVCECVCLAPYKKQKQIQRELSLTSEEMIGIGNSHVR